MTTITADRFRRGDRVVTMTPPAGLRFGNWLYLWLHAHAAREAGQPWAVLESPGMREWFEPFPRLRGLTVDRDELRFHDRRDWGEHSWNQRFDVEFTRPELRAFISEVLAPDIAPDPSDTIVVNIRRGDYYAQDHLRAIYQYDQVGYVTAALERMHQATRIRLVSDDPEWSRTHLDAVFRRHASEVEYLPPDPVAHFRAVSATRRLIGTNSTFSYWGGYIADVLHEDAEIVMPRFHGRMAHGSEAIQLDPTWTIIDGFH